MLVPGCWSLRNRQLHVRLKYALQHAEASWGSVRSTTSVACDPCVLPVAYPAYMIWGANTDVGKTLFSAGLAAAASRRQVDLSFIKPVQTGFPSDSDARLVAAASGAELHTGTHAARLLSQQQQAVASTAPNFSAQTMFAWTEPTSPHITAVEEGHSVTDTQLQHAVQQALAAFGQECSSRGTKGIALAETAGGPASPAPSGSLQCDCWRPLRLPSILVGDSRLGGISTTLSAYETLVMRGYDVPAIVMAGGPLAASNSEAIQQHARPDTAVFTLDQPLPAMQATDRGTSGLDQNLQHWLHDTQAAFDTMLTQLFDYHDKRVAKLDTAKAAAKANLWWPFTQHANVQQDDVTVIDARCGEQYAVYQPAGANQTAQLQLQYDACASWWTQGVNGELQPKLVQSMAHAAGRYGHVIFPESAHQPALDLADKLLSTVGKGWAHKVFFSDNGSTATEVALKMAMRKYVHDRPGMLWKDGPALHVVGITNGYHGDTLGAMDAVADSPFNDTNQTPWFQSRGLFLDPPTVGLTHGAWQVDLPSSMTQPGKQQTDLQLSFDRQDDVFGDRAAIQSAYLEHIQQAMEQYEGRADVRIAACILEPVLQGAGGMVMIDPPFQRAMVHHCRARNIPVIFDEVFSGIWRLGHMSAAQMLGVQPDIACYAKLLTGGMLPLSATLASNSVFEAFQDKSKLKALLHGHSYTAHAIGCSAAVTALDLYTDPKANPNYRAGSEHSDLPCLQQLWDSQLVDQLSRHDRVQKVVALGTVLAVELKTSGVAGYSATEAAEITKALRQKHIFARPLGNVVYLMVTPTTAKDTCTSLLERLLISL